MNATVEIRGLDKAVKALDVLPDKFQRRAVLPMLRRSTRPLIRSARSKLLGYGSSYSNLSKAIGNITAKSRNPIIFVGPRVKGKWKFVGYIAHWVEYGTKGVKKSRGGSARKPKDEPYAKVVAMVPRGGRFRADEPARPFMRPAIDQEKNNVGEQVSLNFEKFLDKQIKRLLPKV